MCIYLVFTFAVTDNCLVLQAKYKSEYERQQQQKGEEEQQQQEPQQQIIITCNSEN